MELLTPGESSHQQSVIENRVERMWTPLEGFVRKQATSGVLLAAAIIISMIIANSPWNVSLKTIADIKLGFSIGNFTFSLTFLQWVSDGLLALFFFLVGLEIKREMLIGQLRQPQQAVLVVMTAAGGMIVPALIYWLFNHNGPGHFGWAIPMTTDTAFAIGILTLLKRHVSISATIFLTALAIIDDIITIIIIAFFYSHDLHMDALLKALIPLALLLICNITGIRYGLVYAILGGILWWFVHESGVHATLAGILMAFMIPARPQISQLRFIEKLKDQIFNFEKRRNPEQTILKSHSQHQLALDMGTTVRAASTPLQSWHALLEHPIAIFILPLFALLNAGILLSTASITDAMGSSISQGIIAGFVIGKPLGVILFGLLAVRLKIACLPAAMSWNELIGVEILAGIGFTMSLFIALLGFEKYPDFIEAAKIGIVFSSFIAAGLGVVWLIYAPKPAKQSRPDCQA